jgi:hypothetical protein
MNSRTYKIVYSKKDVYYIKYKKFWFWFNIKERHFDMSGTYYVTITFETETEAIKAVAKLIEQDTIDYTEKLKRDAKLKALKITEITSDNIKTKYPELFL